MIQYANSHKAYLAITVRQQQKEKKTPARQEKKARRQIDNRSSNSHIIGATAARSVSARSSDRRRSRNMQIDVSVRFTFNFVLKFFGVRINESLFTFLFSQTPPFALVALRRLRSRRFATKCAARLVVAISIRSNL